MSGRRASSNAFCMNTARSATRLASPGQSYAPRAQQPIATTLELVDVIRSAMPGAALREKQHPAKRSFQAIRIAVNDELAAVREMMDTAPDKLRAGGRLCVISFHSLEDRIVKTGIAGGSTAAPARVRRRCAPAALCRRCEVSPASRSCPARKNWSATHVPAARNFVSRSASEKGTDHGISRFEKTEYRAHGRQRGV